MIIKIKIYRDIHFLVAFTLDGDNATFTMPGAETGTALAYTISSSGGGTDVTGTVANVTSATESKSSIDISGLTDGTLTVSVKLTDANSNEGSAATKTVVKAPPPPPTPVITVLEIAEAWHPAYNKLSYTVTNMTPGAWVLVQIYDNSFDTNTPWDTADSHRVKELAMVIGGQINANYWLDVAGLDNGTLTFHVRLKIGDNIIEPGVTGTVEKV